MVVSIVFLVSSKNLTYRLIHRGLQNGEQKIQKPLMGLEQTSRYLVRSSASAEEAEDVNRSDKISIDNATKRLHTF